MINREIFYFTYLNQSIFTNFNQSTMRICGLGAVLSQHKASLGPQIANPQTTYISANHKKDKVLKSKIPEVPPQI
jgi:hypothetical protein